MRGIAGLTAVRLTPRRKRTHPYQAQSITDALAALPPDEPARPQPTFAATQPSAAPVTAPMAALPGNAKVPPPPAVPAWADANDRDAMQRTIWALRDVDFTAVNAAQEQEGMTYAAVLAARAPRPAPAPDLSRAERFTADMRFRGGLPLFRKTAAAVGWRGLNEEPPRTGWVQYTVARWDQQARVAIAAATEAALAEVHADFDAARQRVMAPGPATAGAR